MIRTQIYLPEDIYENLKLISKTSDLNFSQLIREGVKKEIESRLGQSKGDDWKQFAGALKTGPKDLSVRVNDIYK